MVEVPQRCNPSGEAVLTPLNADSDQTTSNTVSKYDCSVLELRKSSIYRVSEVRDLAVLLTCSFLPRPNANLPITQHAEVCDMCGHAHWMPFQPNTGYDLDGIGDSTCV